jgi:hypothetical protein
MTKIYDSTPLMVEIVQEAEQWLDGWKSNHNNLRIVKVVNNTIFLNMGEYYNFEIQVRDGIVVFELSEDIDDISSELKFVCHNSTHHY